MNHGQDVKEGPSGRIVGGGGSAGTGELGLDEVDAASAASMDASDPPAFGGATGVGAGREDPQQTIARRAYELWHDAGCPEGRALDYWLAAERELGLAADARELTN